MYNWGCSKVTAPMGTNLLFVRNRFYGRWGSLMVDIGALMRYYAYGEVDLGLTSGVIKYLY